MTIESAKEYRALALQYRKWGFNLVPLGADKRPVVTGILPNGRIGHFFWEDWKETAQTDERWAQIKKHEWWKEVGGLAAVCGPVSGDLLCIDFDTPKDRTDLKFPFALVEQVLAALNLEATRWLVDSPRGGFHVWVRCPGLLLDKGKLDRPAIGQTNGYHIELRWIGHYAALPGSQHPNGLYRWHGAEPNDPPPTVGAAALLAAYDAVTVQEAPKVQALPAAPSTNGNGYHANGDGGRKWARTAFDAELLELRGTSSNRNDALNKAAFALGSIVAGGYLDEGEVATALTDAAEQIGLDAGEIYATIQSGLRASAKTPRHPSHTAAAEGDVYAYGFVAETPDPLDLDATEQGAPAHHTWPYSVRDGRMAFLHEDKNGEIAATPIASFTASICGQVEDEDGAKTFIIQGEAVRGGPYTLEFPAEKFGNASELRSGLEKAVGPYDPVYTRMAEHLIPAIKLFTTEDTLYTVRRYRRTGWRGGDFLMPGMEGANTRIELPDKLPYRVSADADWNTAQTALTNLIECVDPAISTPILSMLLQAPLHRPAGWQNERYGMFIQGRTGSLKTSFTQAIMSIYGPEFSDDRSLIKLGEGATRNAIMAYATGAHDMPLFIDNYKPNTGFGFHDLVNLIHNILEGGEKDRLTRASQIKEARPIHCFPIITGEDVPDHDPATLARLLLVGFEWQAGQPNAKLSAAQTNSAELCAVGLSWLGWVTSEEGQRTIKETAKALPLGRDRWAAHLREERKDMVNILRVATNLATNELTWSIALQHPLLGGLLVPYTQAHGDGLRRIAQNMAKSTTEALECVRFLAGLRELLATGQGVLIYTGRSAEDVTQHERERMVGWQDEEGVYLLPSAALEHIRKLLGPQSITASLQTLYSQFDGLHMIAKKGKDKMTRTLRVQGEVQRVLHLIPDALQTADEETESAVTPAMQAQIDAALALGL